MCQTLMQHGAVDAYELSLTPIPEPGGLALLPMGLVCLLFRRLRGRPRPSFTRAQ